MATYISIGMYSCLMSGVDCVWPRHWHVLLSQFRCILRVWHCYESRSVLAEFWLRCLWTLFGMNVDPIWLMFGSGVCEIRYHFQRLKYFVAPLPL